MIMKSGFGIDWRHEATCVSLGGDYFVDTEKQIVRIYSAKGLVWFAKQVNEREKTIINSKLIVLEADLDLGGKEWKPIEEPFDGIFDGQGHVIRHLTIFGNYKYSGFFGEVKGKIGKLAVIRNLRLEDVRIDCWGKAGVLAGSMEYAEVSNCLFTGSVISGNEVGAMAACLENCKIADCYSWVNIKSLGLDAGGMAANIKKCSIEHCFVAGEVEGLTCAGGMAAIVSGSLISGCFAAGIVTGSEAPGGLVGILKKSSYIEFSYSTAKVKCIASCLENCLGGFLGQNYDPFEVSDVCRVTNCYAAGMLDGRGRFTGAFCGSGFGRMEECWYDENLNQGMPAIGEVIDHVQCQDFPVALKYRKDLLNNRASNNEWLTIRDCYPQLRYFAEHADDQIRNTSMVSAYIK